MGRREREGVRVLDRSATIPRRQLRARDRLAPWSAAGLAAEIVRWTRKDLDGFVGFVFPGGFSFQDRVRAGAVAAREPAIEAVARAAPTAGRCSGSAMAPRCWSRPGSSPTWTRRVRSSSAWRRTRSRAAKAITATGCYVAPTVRGLASAFGRGLTANDVIPVLAAHGEGRFVTHDPAVEAAIGRTRSWLPVCRRRRRAGRGFPANPNGSLADAAGRDESLAATSSPSCRIPSAPPGSGKWGGKWRGLGSERSRRGRRSPGTLGPGSRASICWSRCGSISRRGCSTGCPVGASG